MNPPSRWLQSLQYLCLFFSWVVSSTLYAQSSFDYFTAISNYTKPISMNINASKSQKRLTYDMQWTAHLVLDFFSLIFDTQGIAHLFLDFFSLTYDMQWIAHLFLDFFSSLSLIVRNQLPVVTVDSELFPQITRTH